MSAADGMFSAPIATSCACAAFSRASNARPIAPVSSGFSSRSDSALPRRSSVVPLKRSRRLRRHCSRRTCLLLCSSRRPAGGARDSPPREEGYGAAMPQQLFVFIQMEFPWALGPADGRYLLRRGPDGRARARRGARHARSRRARRSGGVRTAPQRPLLSRLQRRTPSVPTDPEPAPVATTRVDGDRPGVAVGREPGAGMAGRARPRPRGAARRSRSSTASSTPIGSPRPTRTSTRSRRRRRW